MKLEKTREGPHPYADVIDALVKAEAMDPARGGSRIEGSYTIRDLIREVREQTEFGRTYAEAWRKSRMAPG